MTWQTSAPIEDYRHAITNRSVRELARMVEEGDMILDPSYQRTSVWTADQRLGLIHSWIRGLPIPSIVVSLREHPYWTNDDVGIHALVDGRQRIETALALFRSDLPIPASWLKPDDVITSEETADGLYVRFSGMSLARQRHIGRGFTIPMVEVQLASVAEEAALYVLLNSAGTAQTAADLDRARAIADQKGSPL